MNKKMIEVNDRIIAGLEKGLIPWRQTWINSDNHNPLTGTIYRGINWALTTLEMMEKKYEKPLWVTYLQAKEKGGYIKKGEKGTSIFYYETVKKKKEDDTDDDEFYYLQRCYVVFNVSQCETVEISENKRENIKNMTAEALIKAYVEMPQVFTGNPAYWPTKDQISMPDIGSFDDSNEYYAALFHELAHSVTRKIDAGIDIDGNYSFGELVAEITACHLCNHVGIMKNWENTTAYINSWASTLKNNPGLVIRAIQFSSKVFDYIIEKTKSATGAQ